MSTASERHYATSLRFAAAGFLGVCFVPQLRRSEAKMLAFAQVFRVSPLPSLGRSPPENYAARVRSSKRTIQLVSGSRKGTKRLLSDMAEIELPVVWVSRSC